jgi:hypothetical protein
MEDSFVEIALADALSSMRFDAAVLNSKEHAAVGALLRELELGFD